MKISIETDRLVDLKPELLVIPVFEEDIETDSTSRDQSFDPRLRLLRERGDFKGGTAEFVLLYPESQARGTLILAGLGKRTVFDSRRAYSVGNALAKRLGGRAREVVFLSVPSEMHSNSELLRSFVEGLTVGSVGAGLYKKETERHAIQELKLVFPDMNSLDLKASETFFGQGVTVGKCVNWARELVNLAPRDKTPRRLAELIHDTLAPLGVLVEVWDEERISRERFGGLLGVSQGSDSPPRMVLLEWKGAPQAPALALVGKGVTFDSGGISLKPSSSMEDMKCDMSGAAVVAAAFRAVAQLGLPVHWRGYLPLTENMTGGQALKLGDVLPMRNGITVEVLNTDAEGRLILADALSYAVEQKPEAVIDLATLTGACLVALGTKIAGLFANDPLLKSKVQAAAALTGERVWELPLDDDFADGLRSQVADCKNIAGKWGGAVTAAKFLEKFVGDVPWVHLDIAGPSWSEAESASIDSGGTGFFVRSLVRLADSELESLKSNGFQTS